MGKRFFSVCSPRSCCCSRRTAEGKSYFHWVASDGWRLTPLKAFVGVCLLVAWVILLRATIESLGAVDTSSRRRSSGTLICDRLVDASAAARRGPDVPDPVGARRSSVHGLRLVDLEKAHDRDRSTSTGTTTQHVTANADGTQAEGGGAMGFLRVSVTSSPGEHRRPGDRRHHRRRVRCDRGLARQGHHHSLIGMIGGQPDFEPEDQVDQDRQPINAVISFVIKAAAVYFFLVVPFQQVRDRLTAAAAPPSPSEQYLRRSATCSRSVRRALVVVLLAFTACTGGRPSPPPPVGAPPRRRFSPRSRRRRRPAPPRRRRSRASRWRGR